MYVAGLPYHVVQRGNNREACFYSVEDYQFYLHLLDSSLHCYQVNLHAFVLMTNHIHLLASPEDKAGISNLTRVVGSRFAQYMNKKYGRTGTLWEGRHKSSVVDSEAYLLKCYMYIELNPVAARMVASPGEYLWSSYGSNAWGAQSSLVTPHSEYLRLGNTQQERCHSYRALFSGLLSEDDLNCIRKAAHYCQPLGDDSFREKIKEKTGQAVGHMKRGRPKKMAK